MRYGIDSRWHDNISHPPKNRHMVQMNRYNSRGYPGSGFSLRPRDLSSNESEDMRSTVVPNKEALKEKMMIWRRSRRPSGMRCSLIDVQFRGEVFV